jgi:hypothetical protein
MSKFQLQMSGQWNQQVMTGASKAGIDNAAFDYNQPFGPAQTESDTGSYSESERGAGGGSEWGTEGGVGVDRSRGTGGMGSKGGMGWSGNPDDLPKPFDNDNDADQADVGRFFMDPRGAGGGVAGGGGVGLTGDIPEDLSAYDMTAAFMPNPRSATRAGVEAGVGVGALAGVEIGAGVGVRAVAGDGLVTDVLAELDRDYLALRSRLVSLIEKQQQPQQQQQQQLLQSQTLEQSSSQPQPQPQNTIADTDPLLHSAIAATTTATTSTATTSTAAGTVADIGVFATVSAIESTPARKYWPPGNRHKQY